MVNSSIAGIMCKMVFIITKNIIVEADALEKNIVVNPNDRIVIRNGTSPSQ